MQVSTQPQNQRHNKILPVTAGSFEARQTQAIAPGAENATFKANGEIYDVWQSLLAPVSRSPDQERHELLQVNNVVFHTVDHAAKNFSIGGKTAIYFDTKPVAPVVNDVKLSAHADNSLKSSSILDYVDFGLFFTESAKFIGRLVSAFRSDLWELFSSNVLGHGQKKAAPDTTEAKKEEEKRKKEGEKIKNKTNFFRSLNTARNSLENRVMLHGKREDTNKKIKSGNVSYEGTVDDSGKVRIDVEILIDKANSQLAAEQLKAKREKMLAKTNKSRGKKGPGVSMNLNKAHEDANNVTKLIG